MSQQLLPANFIQQIEASSTEYSVAMLRTILSGLKPTIEHYLPYLIGLLFMLLIIASVKAMLGRTGALGSLLYHIFYFGILGIIIKVKGLEVLFNPYFDLICAIVYRFCYWLTGLILNKFRRRYPY